MKAKQFLTNMAKGAVIGIAMIIPGVSGGTLAVLMKIYDKLIDSISNLRRQFKQSMAFLVPLLLGAGLAIAAALWPIKKALEYAPFPTMLLFAGLMAGSCPKIFADNRKNGFKKIDIAALVIPFVVVLGLCFIPGMTSADLSQGMPWYAYLLLLLVGVVASCALVVPGISGSMLLMILGYYTPMLGVAAALFDNPLHSLLVLACFAVGVFIGFFSIAKLMQILLHKYTRATCWAIFGFVVGSIPAIVVTYFDKYGALPQVWQLVLGIVLFFSGAVGTFFLEKTATSAEDCEKPEPSETEVDLVPEAADNANPTSIEDGNAEQQ